MSNLFWLLAANVAVWAGIGAYVCFLACAQSALERRVRHMEMIDHG